MTACLCCGESKKTNQFSVPELLFGTRETFGYEECGRCGSLQICSVPEDLGRYYPTNYFSFKKRGMAAPTRLSALVRKTAGRIVLGPPGLAKSAVLRATSPSWADWFQAMDISFDEPVLDVGSGSGGLLLNLARYGFANLNGVDPFVPEDIEYANGVRISKKHLEDVVGQYRVVIFSHSLEHTTEPLGQLRHARRVLGERGRVVVRVPVLGGSWERYGVFFYGLDAPRHIFVPSVEGMKILAARAGLKTMNVLHDGNGEHAFASEQRAVHEGVGKTPLSSIRLARLRGRIRARWQNLAGKGDAATFVLEAQ